MWLRSHIVQRSFPGPGRVQRSPEQHDVLERCPPSSSAISERDMAPTPVRVTVTTPVIAISPLRKLGLRELLPG